MQTISLNKLCKLWPELSRETWREWRKAAVAASEPGKSSWNERFRSDVFEARREALEAAGELLGLNVESIFNQSLNDPCGLYYVNTGDTYRVTLRLHDSGTIDAGTWGDWLESMERRGVHFD